MVNCQSRISSNMNTDITVIGEVMLLRTPELRHIWSMAVSPLMRVSMSPILALLK